MTRPVRDRQRGLRPFAPALERVRDELAPATLLAEVQRVWRGAVGAVIAAEARPSAERAGTLTVACSASVWAQELDLMAPAILEQVNARLREGTLTRLRCITVPPLEDN